VEQPTTICWFGRLELIACDNLEGRADLRGPLFLSGT
jgi:hypothetical protein